MQKPKTFVPDGLAAAVGVELGGARVPFSGYPNRVSELNARFASGGTPTNDLGAAGVLVHAFDQLSGSQDDGSWEFLPCPTTGPYSWCGKYSDRWSATLVHRNDHVLYPRAADKGFIIAPSVRILCSYPADGNSMARVCAALGGDGVTCVPGCDLPGRGCTYRNQKAPLPCSYEPHELALMMEEKALGDKGPLGTCAPCNNEVVVDAADFVAKLPGSVQAFWGDRKVHRAFLEMYRAQGATEQTVPFVHMNLGSSRPFS